MYVYSFVKRLHLYGIDSYMKIKITYLVCFLLVLTKVPAQQISATVLDSLSREPIPFASIALSGKSGVITNEEGRFRLRLPEVVAATDTLVISSLGYKPYAVAVPRFRDSLVYLAPKPIALDAVTVYNRNLDVETLMEEVLTGLEDKYDFGLSQKQVFLRESQNSEVLKMEAKITKSSIPEFNQRFFDNLFQEMPRENAFYMETLAELHGDLSPEKQKINIIKAAELLDESKEITFESFEKRFNSILNKRTKKDSYFKIKSGWFGSKVDAKDFYTIDEAVVDSTDTQALTELQAKQQKKDTARMASFTRTRKGVMAEVLNSFFEKGEWKISILKKSNHYQFNMEAFTFLGDTPVYKVTFTPEKKGKYKGSFFIDADRLALIRLDFVNTKRVRNFKLLGLYFRLEHRKGKILFKRQENDKYALSYFELESGSVFGLERPLKIIEKNKNVKGRRKQNELSMDLEMSLTQRDKLQLAVLESKSISPETYEAVVERRDKKPEKIFKYDPNFWKAYNIIEPDEAIKALQIDPDSN